MIPHCFNPSLPPFSFLEEGGSGVCLKKCSSSVESPLWNSVSASILNEDERVVEVSCGGEGVLSGSYKGQQWSDLEMGKGVDRGWLSEVGKGDVSSRGMELVPNAGLDGGELLVWGRQNEDLFNHLGWIQDETDDRLLVSNGVFNPLVRESEGRWNDADVLTSGMSQEVSKWVSKRINGFCKFLGLSFDGFEERMTQPFMDIEERWRKGAVPETKKSGSKNRKG